MLAWLSGIAMAVPADRVLARGWPGCEAAVVLSGLLKLQNIDHALCFF